MWGSVLVVTVLSALNPVRLALTLLMVTRFRPLQNLLGFWAGCLAGAVVAVLVPLTLLHATAISGSLGQGGVTSPTVRNVQIGMGVLALSMAAVVAARALTGRRRRPRLKTRAASEGPHEGDPTSTMVLDSDTPSALSRLLGDGQDAGGDGGSASRRLLRRARTAWEHGSLWISFLLGMALGGPQPDVALFVVAIIAGSGAAVATQAFGAATFVVGTFGLIEIILVSYLVAPTKTLAVLRRLHDWVSRRRQEILAAIFAVVGVALVTNGMGLVGVGG